MRKKPRADFSHLADDYVRKVVFVDLEKAEQGGLGTEDGFELEEACDAVGFDVFSLGKVGEEVA